MINVSPRSQVTDGALQMSADPIVYCLEHLTDYKQFERLCTDVMSQSGYADIEPFGGTNDRGRDALHVSRTDPDDITIFAYSVRSDWQQKLHNEDCVRIRDEGHKLNRVVFATTATITAMQRDQAKDKVRDEHGWELELYGLERLRVRLAGELRHLVARHPAIFCPPFFPRRGGVSIAESRDTLVIDHVDEDHALAAWLSRRLQLAGYRTWCFGTAPLAGENNDDSIRALLKHRALRYLPILSRSSVVQADFVGRCGLACGVDDLTLPCRSGAFDGNRLPAKMRELTSAPFCKGWSDGLRALLDALDSAGIAPELDAARGQAIALKSYVPEPLTRPVPEKVYTNTFATSIPAAIQVCELKRDLSQTEQERLRQFWPFAKASSKVLLSFDDPPNDVPLRLGDRREKYAWSSFHSYHGKRSLDVVKELVRRSLDVACVAAGFRWCGNRKVFYLSQDKEVHRRASYVHVDGRKTWVVLTGEKTQGSGESGKKFRYQLCPLFRVGFDEDKRCWVTLRIYVRITDTEGNPLQHMAITRRRKTVAKSWWNKEWMARTIAMIQAISKGASEIRIGTDGCEVVVECQPLQWECPVSIDYQAVERLGDFQEEMALLRYEPEDDDEEPDTGSSDQSEERG